MKWTITNVMYAFVACVLMTGLFRELNLQWVGNAFVVLDLILIMVAFLKYLHGDHLS